MNWRAARFDVPGCQSVQVVPEDSTEDYDLESAPGEGGTDGRLNAAFNHDKFLLRQKLMTIGSKYVVWDEQQQPILFIERPLYFWRNLLAAFAAAICFLVSAPLSVVVGLGIGQVLHQDVVGVVFTIVFLVSLDRADVRRGYHSFAQAAHRLLRR